MQGFGELFLTLDGDYLTRFRCKMHAVDAEACREVGYDAGVADERGVEDGKEVRGRLFARERVGKIESVGADESRRQLSGIFASAVDLQDGVGVVDVGLTAGIFQAQLRGVVGTVVGNPAVEIIVFGYHWVDIKQRLM